MDNAELIKALRWCQTRGCSKCVALLESGSCKYGGAIKIFDAAADALEAADKRIAELEAQISERDAANVIILPCNIGDKIYYCRFDKDGAGWITPMIVCGIHVTKFRTKEKDGEQYLVCELPWFSRSVHVPLKELGKTLFLTEEEAKRCISNA